jgi:beta-glucosidase
MLDLSPFSFSRALLTGTATAATQIEGGGVRHSWSRWAELGHTKDGSLCDPANDHWNRLEEDVELLKELGCSTHRFGLEWARIEPSNGQFDPDAIAHYRHEIELLRHAGIVPLVTLHHFTNPIWFEDSGGWLRSDAPEIFARFAAHVVVHLGDLVSEWVIINEPNVYLFNGYAVGEWPPGHRSIPEFLAGARNLIRAHKRVYLLIHALRAERGYTDTRIGSALHFRLIDPFRPTNVLDRLVSRGFDHLFHDLFLKGVLRGRFLFPLRRETAADRRIYRDLRLRIARHTPEGTTSGEGNYSDFLGINYYSREMVQFAFGQALPFGKLVLVDHVDRNDLGWEIYPEGLSRICRGCWQRYRIPIYITENGTCDSEDRFRTRYLYEHLFQVHGLTEEGVDIRRYYYWTLMDNFEWAEGTSARFGLVHVDFLNQERTIRTSGRFFSRINRERAVTAECLDDFADALRHRGAEDPKPNLAELG